MFWFLLIALVAVVAAVTLAVVGGDDGAALPEAQPDRLEDAPALSRPLGRADVEAVRFPVVVRGYRMTDVDDVLGRLGAELAERDARIAELESSLAGAQAAALGTSDLFGGRPGARPPRALGPAGDQGAGARPDAAPGPDAGAEPDPGSEPGPGPDFFFGTGRSFGPGPGPGSGFRGRPGAGGPDAAGRPPGPAWDGERQ